MAGLPDFRAIFAQSRTEEEARRVRWAAAGHALLFALVCAATVMARDGVPAGAADALRRWVPAAVASRAGTAR
jgi:hypothetical protein